MVKYIAPVEIGDTIYDAQANAWIVYSVQFYAKNIALKCSSVSNDKNKTFLVGKKSIGKTIFVGESAFEDAVKASSSVLDKFKPDEDFEKFKF